MFSRKKGIFRLFDEHYYTRSYPDVLPSGMKPYNHFLRIGVPEMRSPCAIFDTEYYLSQVNFRSGDPTEHYQTFGIRMGAEPHPTFDREWYLANNPDVAADGADPLWHFFRHGRSEGRKPGPPWRIAFDGAKRPLWRLANRKPARRPLRLRFGPGDGAQPSEFHAVYGLAIYMPPAQLLQFTRESGRYQGSLRPEAGLKPNVVVILSSADVSSDPDHDLRASYASAKVFFAESPDSSPAFELGAGRLLIDRKQ